MFMLQSVWILLILLARSLCFVHGATFEDLKLLQETLFTNYSNLLRPKYNFSEATLVGFSMKMSDVINLDEIQQILKLFCSFQLSWTDDFLTWDPNSFGGLSKIQVDSHLVWKPYIDLLSSLDDSDLFAEKNARLTVFSNGTVQWYPRQIITLKCDMKVERFPFDRSTCNIVFVPLKYTSDEVQLQEQMDRDNYHIKVYGEWDFNILSFAVSNLKFDDTENVVSAFNVSIIFSRTPLFFAVSALFPVVLLSFLNVFAFCLPDNSGEKTSFSITLLLALAVFLTSIGDSLPKSSMTVNYITVYITSLLVISCLIVMTNIFLLYSYHKRQRKEDWERNNGTAQDTTDNTRTIHTKLKCIWNRIRCKSKYDSKSGCTIDMLLFLFYLAVWVTATFFYMTYSNGVDFGLDLRIRV
ncbi:hypothetical protein SNE40_006474 [Patella caerulea]|uniref:Uncharacterized protein n=1 Tax=Patella caerulea TaxID=87958 RepID=A0AAN8K077_PATCE